MAKKAKHRVKVISAATKMTERQAIIKLFQRDEVELCQFIVSTTRIMSLGFNCTREMKSLILESCLEMNDENQSIARIYQCRQLFKTESSRLVLVDSKTDLLIIDKQVNRANFNSRALGLPRIGEGNAPVQIDELKEIWRDPENFKPTPVAPVSEQTIKQKPKEDIWIQEAGVSMNSGNHIWRLEVLPKHLADEDEYMDEYD